MMSRGDYLIFVEGVEVGATWNRVSNNSGNEYVSLQLSAPEFPRRIYANVGVSACQDDPSCRAGGMIDMVESIGYRINQQFCNCGQLWEVGMVGYIVRAALREETTDD